ncbi:MAG: TspO/MBR family protein [Nanoarchaeota archaeon]
MKTKNLFVLIGLIILTELVGILGSLTQTGSSEWFKNLVKPAINPPTWVFAPVWTTLYLLIALSIYFVYTNKKISTKTKKIIYFLFGLQLILNGIWTPLFFGLENMALALLDIIILSIAIIILEIYYYKYSKISFYLFLPYILWVLFATILNYRFLVLN